MVDLKKVIEGMEHCCSSVPRGYHCISSCHYGNKVTMECDYQNMLKDALALLKEQEPKPVGKEWNECPNCGKVLSSIEHIHFCGMCGQAVEWE